ncbi:kinase-like domain-containing protein [Chytriomyces sp. MP71]|nr:kinase-like domain-containing protein [Chytriomyces sp. MP71]
MANQAPEAISRFFSSRATVANVEPCSGGVNNFVFYVDVSLGDDPPSKYVLRIYNNGNSEDKVLFEHFILTNLSSRDLTFQLPIPIKSTEGTTFIELMSGTHAALFLLIPGSLPKLHFARSIGHASGQLSRALAQVSVPDGMQVPTPPYHDLYAAHASVKSSSVFLSFVGQTAFNGVRETMDFLCDRIAKMEKRIKDLSCKNFPCQLIHGDLHYDNVLCDLKTGVVHGILDFEFTALDWRAMELAICLSKYAGEPEPFIYFNDFVAGYAEGDGARLTAVEVENLPQLIVLRILSNIVFFVGRAIAGEDTIETLTERVKSYARRIVWLEENEAKIIKLIQQEQVNVRNKEF